MIYDLKTAQFVGFTCDRISSRFAKIRGRSGRNYVVTEIPLANVSDYSNCVVIAVERARIVGVWLKADECKAGNRTVSKMDQHCMRGAERRWFLHFLSDSNPHVIEDLQPSVFTNDFSDHAIYQVDDRQAA